MNLLRAGRKAGLLCSAIACAAAMGIWAGIAGARQLGEWWVQISVGVLSLACVAWVFGGRLAPRVTRPGFTAFIIGGAFACGALVASAVAGSITNFFVADSPFVFGLADGVQSWVVKPVFWISCGGVVPAVALGCMYVALVRAIAR